jgi:oligoribonuclease NrnB/cAMP/cGMP phosphodiesterase (DHH superfamily)
MTESSQATVAVLYHANCMDGVGSAWAARANFYGEPDGAVEYIPVQYGQEPPPLDDPERFPNLSSVYILDFSYPRDVLLRWRDRFETILVLDHHKSAEEDLRGLDFASFDMDKSGAVMAWEEFHPGVPVPTILRYIQDRDLWRWGLPSSKEVSAYLKLNVRSFWDLDMIHEQFVASRGMPPTEMIQVGRTVLRVQEMMVEEICHKRFLIEVGGYEIPTVNSPILQSEIGEKLCRDNPDRPFSAVYSGNNQRAVWSLRSKGEFDVSKVAREYGGGGHRNAAGFTITKEDAVRLLTKQN